jgi:GT2 family glycosyltransferase
MSHDVTFIIVTYNSEKVIEASLEHLPPGNRIIVLDNSSRDGTVERAMKCGASEVIKNRNIGYGNAANIGLSMVTTPYAVLLNPDVVVSAESIAAMLDCIKQHQDIGIVGARMFHYVNGGKHYEETYDFDDHGVHYANWVIGALMMFNMDILRQVGMFDKNIFLYFEETDLCNRMLKAGYKLAICQHAEAEHELGTSSLPSARVTKIKAWHIGWSRAYYFNKHSGLAKTLRKSAVKIYKNIIGITCNGMLCLLRMRREPMRAIIYETMGTLSYFIGLKAFKKDGTARIT